MLSHDVVLAGWLASAVCAFATLFVYNAPYGKFFSNSWGMKVNGSLGWLAQEIPSPIALWLGITRGSHVFREFASSKATSDMHYVHILALLWSAHYANRAVVYPLTRALGDTAVVTVASAVAFNVVNGLLVGAEMAHVTRMPSHARVAIGASTMLAGAMINITSEAQLRRRRLSRAIPAKERRGTYVMPKGGLFDHLVMPHYLGEFIEWCGFATLANTKSAWAFAFWTAANLYPRALANKHWYANTFPNYPRTISSMFPGLP